MKIISYICIVILFFVVLMQIRGCKEEVVEIRSPKVDTVMVYKYVYDTIPGKPVYIKMKVDTSIWMKKVENIPDTTYKGLLSQYKNLGNRYFSTNVFKTDFPIADYGSISVIDTLRENKLIGNNIVTDIKIPVTTITIEKQAPPKRQLFIGAELAGSRNKPLSDVYGGILFKTKKNNIYGVSLGFSNEIKYKGSVYFPIK
jgi:hypothetical protein